MRLCTHELGARAIVTDICVPISALAKAIDETRNDLIDSGLQGPILGHVGDGNFHAILLIDEADADEVARAKAASHRMVKRALALGGTSTGEHGIGIGKLELHGRRTRGRLGDDGRAQTGVRP